MGLFGSHARVGASAAGSYEIERSLRFNDEDSAYLHRTFSSDGNLKLFTYSFWFKYDVAVNADGDLNSPPIFGAGYSGGGASQGDSGIRIDSGQLNVYHESNNSTDWSLKTSRVFRDPGSWYHVVTAFDTAQAVAANRLKLWINGVLQTDFATSGRPGQNDDCKQNKANVRIGARDGSGSPYDYWEGYLAEWHVVDGAAKEAADFGEFDSSTGQWIPKEYTGTHGTNGYYLDFSDNSGATATTIGADASANSNNFTPVNFSVAAGAANDSVTDTPTNNYATLNPMFPNGTEPPGTISDGNLKFVGSGYEYAMCPSTMTIQNGKYYWEVKHGGGSYLTVGIIRGTNCGSDCFVSYDPNGNVFGIGYNQAGNINGSGPGGSTNGAASSSAPNSYTTDDVIGVATDIPGGTIKWYKNNTLEHTITGLNDETWFPAVSAYSNGGTALVNFGQQGFTYTPPTGHVALCSANLPIPTIKDASNHFSMLLYTANGTTDRTLTGVGFSPNLGWFARRNTNGAGSMLFDTVRGATKELYAPYTNAEDTVAESVKSFDADGYTFGNNWPNATGTGSDSWVAWNWKAGGAASSNGDGDITSSVSANTTAGFSIITYAGTGTDADTVGHGLGVAPEMIIIKRRDNGSGSTNWRVWHKGLADTKTLELNESGASATQSGVFDTSTPPTSTVFRPNDHVSVNTSGGTYVAYAFTSVKGYSKVDSYTGNGNANGVFVYTGFRPAYILVKNSVRNAHWGIYDVKRQPINENTYVYQPNLNDAEDTSGHGFDLLSNGFKVRSNGSPYNHSGEKMIYLAIAERSFKYANSR